jgi:hypothetical protein
MAHCAEQLGAQASSPMRLRIFDDYIRRDPGKAAVLRFEAAAGGAAAAESHRQAAAELGLVDKSTAALPITRTALAEYRAAKGQDATNALVYGMRSANSIWPVFPPSLYAILPHTTRIPCSFFVRAAVRKTLLSFTEWEIINFLLQARLEVPRRLRQQEETT